MMTISKHQSYIELLRYARKVTRRADEAEDLLQSVCLAAVEAKRADISCLANRRWLIGALRKRALHDARSAIRRRRRETSITSVDNAQSNTNELPIDFVNSLPKNLRTTALLTLTGHTKAEILWLLRLSDTALRQRIVQIKKRWRAFDGSHISEFLGLKGELAFGSIRQALLKPTFSNDVMLASHDPDGYLFLISSQNNSLRQHRDITTLK